MRCKPLKRDLRIDLDLDFFALRLWSPLVEVLVDPSEPVDESASVACESLGVEPPTDGAGEAAGEAKGDFGNFFDGSPLGEGNAAPVP